MQTRRVPAKFSDRRYDGIVIYSTFCSTRNVVFRDFFPSDRRKLKNYYTIIILYYYPVPTKKMPNIRDRCLIILLVNPVFVHPTMYNARIVVLWRMNNFLQFSVAESSISILYAFAYKVFHCVRRRTKRISRNNELQNNFRSYKFYESALE